MKIIEVHLIFICVVVVVFWWLGWLSGRGHWLVERSELIAFKVESQAAPSMLNWFKINWCAILRSTRCLINQRWIPGIENIKRPLMTQTHIISGVTLYPKRLLNVHLIQILMLIRTWKDQLFFVCIMTLKILQWLRIHTFNTVWFPGCRKSHMTISELTLGAVGLNQLFVQLLFVIVEIGSSWTIEQWLSELLLLEGLLVFIIILLNNLCLELIQWSVAI